MHSLLWYVAISAIMIVASKPARWHAAALTKPSSKHEQQEERLREDFCKSCRIELQRRTRLGALADSLLAGGPSSISTDRFHNYYVTEFRQRDQVLVYSDNGLPLKRLGRRGNGPGEFNSIRRSQALGDSILVFDSGNRRAAVVEVNGKGSRTLPFPAPDVYAIAQLSDSLLVVSAAIVSRERAGMPLHLFHRRLGLQQSFGDVAGIFRPTSPWLNSRAIAPADSGRVWSARQSAYELERWSPVNGRDLYLRRHAPWFEPWLERAAAGAPIKPVLLAVREITPGLLAVMIIVPAPDFAKNIGPGTRRGDVIEYDYSRRNLLYDTIIEIVDVKARTVIHHERFATALAGFVAGTAAPRLEVFSYDETEGIPQVDIFTFSFIPTNRS